MHEIDTSFFQRATRIIEMVFFRVSLILEEERFVGSRLIAALG